MSQAEWLGVISIRRWSVDSTLRALELQHALQRFTTEFTDRVTQAMEELERSSQTGVTQRYTRPFRVATGEGLSSSDDWMVGPVRGALRGAR